MVLSDAFEMGNSWEIATNHSWAQEQKKFPLVPAIFYHLRRKTPQELLREENLNMREGCLQEHENRSLPPGEREENLKRLPSEKQEIVQEFWQQWTEHQEQLYSCCLKFMNFNPTDAEDALSRAMLKAWEHLPKLARKKVHFRAWLMLLTRNLCIDIIRERSREAVAFENMEWAGNTQDMIAASSVESSECALEGDEKCTETQGAIASLPKKTMERGSGRASS